MQLHDAAVDVVAHEVVAIVDGLGPSLEASLLRNLDRRCAVNIQGRRSCLKKPLLIGELARPSNFLTCCAQSK